MKKYFAVATIVAMLTVMVVQARAQTSVSLTALSPQTGYVGTSITLTGTGFDATSVVQFDTGGYGLLTVTPTSYTATSLVFKAPLNAHPTYVSVSVKQGSGAVSNVLQFQLLETPVPPVIASITPVAVQGGGTVTVTGTGLYPQLDLQIDNSLSLMIPATTPVAYPTSASFVIPATVTAGAHSVRLVNAIAPDTTANPSSNSVSITVTAAAAGGPGGPGGAGPTSTLTAVSFASMTTATPVLASIVPSSGLVGRVVDLYGTALDNVGIVELDGDRTLRTMPTNGNSTSLNLPNSSTHLNLVVPFGAPGAHTLRVTRQYPMPWDGTLTYSNAIPFTILGETLNSVSPTSVRACDLLTLNGANYSVNTFAAFDGDVTTYKLKVPTYVSPDGTSEKVRVPALPAGVHTVQVKYGGGTWSASSMSNPVSFTVIPGGCTTDVTTDLPAASVVTPAGGAGAGVADSGTLSSGAGSFSASPAASGPLSDQIAALQSQLQALLAQQGGASAPTGGALGTPGTSPGFTAGGITITRNLTRGSRGSDVTSLQTYLQSRGYLSTNPTGFFGPATQTAVRSFQKDNGLPATGYVGSMTRAKLNAR